MITPKTALISFSFLTVIFKWKIKISVFRYYMLYTESVPKCRKFNRYLRLKVGKKRQKVRNLLQKKSRSNPWTYNVYLLSQLYELGKLVVNHDAELGVLLGELLHKVGVARCYLWAELGVPGAKSNWDWNMNLLQTINVDWHFVHWDENVSNWSILKRQRIY